MPLPGHAFPCVVRNPRVRWYVPCLPSPVIAALYADPADAGCHMRGGPSSGNAVRIRRAVDSAQETATLSFTIAIVGFGRTTLDDVTYDQDSEITSLPLPEAMGGTFTYSLTPNVPGLTFNAATRVLRGTPTKAGTYPMIYTATDTHSTMASLYFTVAVRPSLRSTWSFDGVWYGDDYVVTGTYVDTLTFTKDRYIFYRAHYRQDGTFSFGWNESGTWDSTRNTVTKTFLHNHDNDDDTPERLTSISKNYTWGDDAHGLLLMHHWVDEDERMDYNFDLYQRVPNPLPSPIGVWRGAGNDGAEFRITVDADGMFRFEAEFPAEGGTETITARWELDEDNYFLNLTDGVETWTPIGGVPGPGESWVMGRFAYAPTDRWDLSTPYTGIVPS